MRVVIPSKGGRFPERDLPAIDFIHLAGSSHRGWSRDLYATEIMNPKHSISPDHQKAMARIGDRPGEVNSPMLNLNNDLTVQELIDIVTFLAERANQAKR